MLDYEQKKDIKHFRCHPWDLKKIRRSPQGDRIDMKCKWPRWRNGVKYYQTDGSSISIVSPSKYIYPLYHPEYAQKTFVNPITAMLNAYEKAVGLAEEGKEQEALSVLDECKYLKEATDD